MNYKLLKQLAYQEEMGDNFEHYVKLFDTVRFDPVDEVEVDHSLKFGDNDYAIVIANNSTGPDVTFFFSITRESTLLPAFATFFSVHSRDFYIIRNVGFNQHHELAFNVDRYDEEAVGRVLDLGVVPDDSPLYAPDFAEVGCDPDFSCVITYYELRKSMDEGNGLFDAIEAIAGKKQKAQEEAQPARNRKPITGN